MVKIYSSCKMSIWHITYFFICFLMLLVQKFIFLYFWTMKILLEEIRWLFMWNFLEELAYNLSDFYCYFWVPGSFSPDTCQILKSQSVKILTCVNGKWHSALTMLKIKIGKCRNIPQWSPSPKWDLCIYLHSNVLFQILKFGNFSYSEIGICYGMISWNYRIGKCFHSEVTSWHNVERCDSMIATH